MNECPVSSWKEGHCDLAARCPPQWSMLPTLALVHVTFAALCGYKVYTRAKSQTLKYQEGNWREVGETVKRLFIFKIRFILFLIVGKSPLIKDSYAIKFSVPDHSQGCYLRQGDIWRGESPYRAKALWMSIHMSKRFATFQKIHHSVF